MGRQSTASQVFERLIVRALPAQQGVETEVQQSA